MCVIFHHHHTINTWGWPFQSSEEHHITFLSRSKIKKKKKFISHCLWHGQLFLFSLSLFFFIVVVVSYCPGIILNNVLISKFHHGPEINWKWNEMKCLTIITYALELMNGNFNCLSRIWIIIIIVFTSARALFICVSIHFFLRCLFLSYLFIAHFSISKNVRKWRERAKKKKRINTTGAQFNLIIKSSGSN